MHEILPTLAHLKKIFQQFFPLSHIIKFPLFRITPVSVQTCLISLLQFGVYKFIWFVFFINLLTLSSKMIFSNSFVKMNDEMALKVFLLFCFILFFPLPASTKASFVSRGHWRDTVERKILLTGLSVPTHQISAMNAVSPVLASCRA